jgi:hypothetical protein
MAQCAVTGRDDDLEQIGAHRQMGGNSEHIHHRWHPDVTGASAEKAAKQSADKRDRYDYPKRNGHTGDWQLDHGRKVQPLNTARDVLESRFVLFRARPFYFCFR